MYRFNTPKIRETIDAAMDFDVRFCTSLYAFEAKCILFD